MMRRLRVLGCLMLLCNGPAATPFEAAPPVPRRAREGLFRLGRQLLATNLGLARRVVEFNGRLYVLNVLNPSIMVSEDGDRISRRIPIRGASGMGIDARGRIYLNDYRMRRVETYDTTGQHLGGFSFGEGERELSVMPDGTVLLNRPQGGFLMSAYAPDGVLQHSFGALKSLKDGNPPPEIDGALFAPAMNKLHMAPGEGGSLYVSFDHLPIVQKYDVASGKLLWETRLESRHLASIQGFFWYPDRPTGRPPTMLKLDGFFPLLSAIAFDPRAQIVYVLSNSGRIFGLDRSGRWMRSYLDEALASNPKLGRPNLGLCFTGGRLLLVHAPKLEARIFEVEVATTDTEKGR